MWFSLNSVLCTLIYLFSLKVAVQCYLLLNLRLGEGGDHVLLPAVCTTHRTSRWDYTLVEAMVTCGIKYEMKCKG